MPAVQTLYSALDEANMVIAPAEARQHRDTELQLLGGLKAAPLGAHSSVTLLQVMDDEGTFFKALEFQVTARWFDIEDQLWLQGSGFKVNMDALTRDRGAVFERFSQVS